MEAKIDGVASETQSAIEGLREEFSKNLASMKEERQEQDLKLEKQMKRLQIESNQNRDFIEKEKSDRIAQVRKLESDVCLAEKDPTSNSGVALRYVLIGLRWILKSTSHFQIIHVAIQSISMQVGEQISATNSALTDAIKELDQRHGKVCPFIFCFAEKALGSPSLDAFFQMQFCASTICYRLAHVCVWCM